MKKLNKLRKILQIINLIAIQERCLKIYREKIISTLAKGEKLPSKNKDHKLVNNYEGVRECHITPDWLLIF
ncbi:type II toxin-antitoxin system mRNA interferase toxin, RelE/StbE family [Leptotrichia sp. oral taxon 215]|uniref:type II toxin-antitoxin system mRNA interferase toxin, RelE/StbE family n=1 Tax=Leptotrichia sp. oral taxon 215 TaxID=712359 RepID=UPI000A038FAC|nr:type II toxin-antitoxin system mRNA interferase toxin, RelE/StbE family [Leptotrichia sp. oral taxon 215]